MEKSAFSYVFLRHLEIYLCSLECDFINIQYDFQ